MRCISICGLAGGSDVHTLFPHAESPASETALIQMFHYHGKENESKHWEVLTDTQNFQWKITRITYNHISIAKISLENTVFSVP